PPPAGGGDAPGPLAGEPVPPRRPGPGRVRATVTIKRTRASSLGDVVAGLQPAKTTLPSRRPRALPWAEGSHPFGVKNPGSVSSPKGWEHPAQGTALGRRSTQASQPEGLGQRSPG